MLWEIEGTDEFADWFRELGDTERVRVAAKIDLLERSGPQLGFPHSSGIRSSRHPHMRELRIQVNGEPYRVLYVFDPRRAGILLLGGSKVGDDMWYEKNVARADRLYDEHLETLRREELGDGNEQS
jgi:hypothetical protein